MSRFPLFLRVAMVLGNPSTRSLHAQTLAPDLAQIELQREMAIKALDAARSTELAKLQEVFLADLDTAERAASTAGRVAELTAITQLRDQVTTGATDPAALAGASKLIAKRHTDYLSAVDRLDHHRGHFQRKKSKIF